LFLVGLRQWAGGRAATAASSCVRSSAVTVSLADSAKIGSIVESIELILRTKYLTYVDDEHMLSSIATAR
jgi:hypothetical protein